MDKWIIKRPKLSNEERSEEIENQETSSINDDENDQCVSSTRDVNPVVNMESDEGSRMDTDLGSRDIAIHFEKKLTDEEKYFLLKNRWKPDNLHEFAASGPRNLKFQGKWLDEFHWLVYSEKMDGAFCNYCTFFSPKNVGKGSHSSVRSLVTLPFRRWKDAKESFRTHQDLEYHKAAVVSAENFIAIREKRMVDISLQLNTVKSAEIQRNREILRSIVETIIFIGRQEIGLRGHRDSGSISLDTPLHNDGNFRSLLRFRMNSGDETLKQHLLQTATLKNWVSTYTSPQIQNELIEICGNIILEKIVAKINASECCTILADGTTDISGVEQYSLCFRYTEKSADGIILREDFLQFIPIEDCTGRGLAGSLIEISKKLKVNLDFLVSQGYDGAAAMSGEWNGCAAAVMEKYPSAIYVHCASHSLNLAVGEACSIPLIRNCLSSIQQIISFFRPSAKREAILKDAIETVNCPTKKKRLMRLCETRWTERLDAVICFKEMFAPICLSLEKIHECGNAANSKNAFSHLHTLKTGGFIVAMVVIHEIFSLAQPLTSYLQGKSVDLSAAVSAADDLAVLLKEMREKAESKFEEVFADAKKIAESIGQEIEVPRIVGRQTNRENYESSSAEVYFRRSIFIPFIDHFIFSVSNRFIKHKNTLSIIENVIPDKVVRKGGEIVSETVETIMDQWPAVTGTAVSIVKNELLLWRQRWVAAEDRPKTFIDALNLCNEGLFPNVFKFLKIGATLAVTIASSERSFSTLRRLKNWIRNSTGEDRLNGLALMSINRNIDITVKEVIDRFAQKQRKINL